MEMERVTLDELLTSVSDQVTKEYVITQKDLLGNVTQANVTITFRYPSLKDAVPILTRLGKEGLTNLDLITIYRDMLSLLVVRGDGKRLSKDAADKMLRMVGGTNSEVTRDALKILGGFTDLLSEDDEEMLEEEADEGAEKASFDEAVTDGCFT